MDIDIDLAKVCRVCLNEGKMMSVFKVNISKKIMACASVQVWPNDELPNQICNKCSAKLHLSFQFKKLCEKSDASLRQYLVRLKEKLLVITDNNSSPASEECKLQQQPEPQPVFIVNAQPEQEAGNQENFIPVVDASQITTYNIQTDLDCKVENILQVQTYDEEFIMPISQIQSGIAEHEQHQIFDPLQAQAIEIHQQQQPREALALNEFKSVQKEVSEKGNINDKSTKRKRKSKQENGGYEKPIVIEDTQCKVCGKILATLTKLNRHMCIHNKNPPYKCSVCHKGYSHSGNFKIHMRMHNDERPFKCTVCSQSCRQAKDLEKHMRTHTGERPYACHLCTKAFATRSNLVAHIRTHTGERPYVCCVCQKAFCQSNELTKHMRTHTGEKSHICNICYKGFNGSSSLIVHRRLHTGERPYTCKICDKSFTQSHTLKVHLKLHSDDCERSISMQEQCKECDKTLGTRKELISDQATNGEEVYCCLLCEERYLQMPDLRLHMKEMHNEAENEELFKFDDSFFLVFQKKEMKENI